MLVRCAACRKTPAVIPPHRVLLCIAKLSLLCSLVGRLLLLACRLLVLLACRLVLFACRLALLACRLALLACRLALLACRLALLANLRSSRLGQNFMLLDDPRVRQALDAAALKLDLLELHVGGIAAFHIPKRTCTARSRGRGGGSLEAFRRQNEVVLALELQSCMLRAAAWDLVRYFPNGVSGRDQSKVPSFQLLILQAVKLLSRHFHGHHLPQGLGLQLCCCFQQHEKQASLLLLESTNGDRHSISSFLRVQQSRNEALVQLHALVANIGGDLHRAWIEQGGRLQQDFLRVQVHQLPHPILALVQRAQLQLDLLLGQPQGVVSLTQLHHPSRLRGRTCSAAGSLAGCRLPCHFGVKQSDDVRDGLVDFALSSHLPEI